MAILCISPKKLGHEHFDFIYALFRKRGRRKNVNQNGSENVLNEDQSTRRR